MTCSSWQVESAAVHFDSPSQVPKSFVLGVEVEDEDVQRLSTTQAAAAERNPWIPFRRRRLRCAEPLHILILNLDPKHKALGNLGRRIEVHGSGLHLPRRTRHLPHRHGQTCSRQAGSAWLQGLEGPVDIHGNARVPASFGSGYPHLHRGHAQERYLGIQGLRPRNGWNSYPRRGEGPLSQNQCQKEIIEETPEEIRSKK